VTITKGIVIVVVPMNKETLYLTAPLRAKEKEMKTRYVVVKAQGNKGRWIVVADGWIHTQCRWENLACTAGHFTNKRIAKRKAAYLNNNPEADREDLECRN